MKIEAEQVLCRFHLSNVSQHGAAPLYEWIVRLARREGLQGATVLKGVYGMRADGPVLTERWRSLAQHLPVIVEVVDAADRIESLLARVEPVLRDGVITLERAHVVMYRAGPRDGPPPSATRHILSTTAASAAIGVRTMKAPEDGVLLRIFIGESDRDPSSTSS